MNQDLKNAGEYYDEKSQSGAKYLIQDDTNAMTSKGVITNGDGSLSAKGTTSDFIKVTWVNGKIASVENFDTTAFTSGSKLANIENTVNNKLPNGRKRQTNNVIVLAADSKQAGELQSLFEGRRDVRVILPSAGFDTAREWHAPTMPGLRKAPKALGLIGDLAFAAQYPVNIAREGFSAATEDLLWGIADPLGMGLRCQIQACGPEPMA